MPSLFFYRKFDSELNNFLPSIIYLIVHITRIPNLVVSP
jgi:hypothetical protein